MHKTFDPSEFSCPAGITDCPLRERISELENRCRELEALVERDPLTGLLNYSALRHTLSVEMERTRRNGDPFALIMMDIDEFKQINDTYGHEVGNCVIQQLASLIDGYTRQSDVVCRYGGDEFAIVLPGSGLFRAIRTAERLRRTIQNTPIDQCGKEIHLTVSSGIEIFTKDCDLTPAHMIKRADNFLIDAKKHGKNRVCAPKPKEGGTDTEITPEERQALVGKNDL